MSRPSILPDKEVIDPANRPAALNALIVYDLAKRAERHGDPYENLEAMYHFAGGAGQGAITSSSRAGATRPFNGENPSGSDAPRGSDLEAPFGHSNDATSPFAAGLDAPQFHRHRRFECQSFY